MTPRICLLVFLLLIGCHSSLCGLTFNQDTFPKQLFAPVLHFAGHFNAFAPITGRIVFETDITTAEARLAGNGSLYRNAIVFANGTNSRSIYPWMERMAIPNGVLAVVMENGEIDESLGTAEFTTAPWSVNYSVPVVAISIVSLKSIYATYRAFNATAAGPAGLLATVTDDGGLTPWRQVLFAPSFWFFSILNAASGCFLSVFALIRVRQFYLAWGKLRASVPLVVIVFEFLGGIVRFIYWSVDPMWKNSLIPPNVHTPIRTWSIPLSLSALLVLIFYWHGIVAGTSLRFSWSIKRFKIPCYTLVAGLFVLEAVSNILYFLGGDVTARAYTSFALPILYILIGLSIVVFFLVTAIRILLRLRKASALADEDSQQNSQRIRPIALKFVIISVLYMFLIGTGLYTLSRPYLQYIPQHYIYFWVTLHIVLSLRSWATLWILNPGPPRDEGVVDLRNFHLPTEKSQPSSSASRASQVAQDGFSTSRSIASV